MPKKIAAILLAGGNSTRMGTNKALLKLDNVLMYEKVLSEIEKITSHIFISSNEKLPLKKNYNVVPDVFINKGPMGGIYSVMQQSNFSNYLVASCDAPFIKKELLEVLMNEVCNTAVVSKWNNKIYPFPGIYNKELEPILLAHLEKNKLKIKDFLNSINAKEVEINPQLKWMNKNVFLNINTPEEYKNLYPCN